MANTPVTNAEADAATATATETAADSTPLDRQPAKYKRKLTDARREQNRRSQRVWREKQKQRRDEELQTKVREELSRRGDRIASNNQVSEILPLGIPLPEISAPPLPPQEQEQQLEFDLDSFIPEPFPGPHADEILAAPPLPLVSEWEELTGDDDSLLLQIGGEDQVQKEEAAGNITLPILTALSRYAPPVPDAENMRDRWPIPEDVPYRMYTLPPGVSPQGSMTSSMMTSRFTSPAPALPHWHSTPRSVYSGSSASHPHGGDDNGGPLPSPYHNHLQLAGESCFAATMTVANALGISLPSYVNDHPSPFTTISNANIHTIPVDLRPTAFQLIIPHPSYLDCIPFPHFRSMAIYLSSVKQLDHTGLYLDLMHDGMVCWGRARANGRFGRSMRDGVAWSKRSWEVRRWFWRKWGWIARMTVESVDAGYGHGHAQGQVLHRAEEDFDDEDGMLSGSQWWWALRDADEAQSASASLSLSLPLSPSLSSSATHQGVIDPGLEFTQHQQHQQQQDGGDQDEEQEEYGSFLSRMVTCNVGIRQTRESHLLVHWD